jgi:anti-sigma regulatory factor (Ser/Thr protein kinase)
LSSHSLAQDFAEYLILRACCHLRYDIRNERYREWTAELPAIFHDPAIRFPGRRIASALLYAADHYRGAQKLSRTSGKNTIAEANGSMAVFTGSAKALGLRVLVADFAKQTNLPEPRITDLILAVSEIIANTLGHTRSGGTLRVWQTEKEILCQIDDTGHIPDPSAGRDGPTPSSGHGLWVVRQVCDQVDIQTSKAGTTVRLHMRLPSAGGVDGGATPSPQASEGRSL